MTKRTFNISLLLVVLWTEILTEIEDVEFDLFPGRVRSTGSTDTEIRYSHQWISDFGIFEKNIRVAYV